MTTAGQRPPPWSFRGRIPHPEAVAWMEERRRRLLSAEEPADDDGDPGEVLLCEHPPVVTLGRHARRDNLLVSEQALERRGVALVETSRGGDATYHGPGQLMIYPVVRVRGVARTIAALAGVLAEVAAELGAPGAHWREDPAGLWAPTAMGPRKLAACGLHLHRRVCIHGFAFNLCTPAAAWSAIRPCGLSSAPISVQELGGRVPPMSEVAAMIGPRVARVLTFSTAARAVQSPCLEPSRT